ncbi:MAG TPA: FHA domain-containing protein [Tepidisphaeraceae bacterium]|nr:FHA domain-containing protein [Tepidisphaeraceae bacterium]
MITAKCQCGGEFVVVEDAANTVYQCPTCARIVRLVCAEQLGEGAGAGDFDARLIIAAGPARVGECILLGGVSDIKIGKLPDKHIQLEANLVSRFHCKLVRVDFGPSRWKIVDNKSTNGLFVNRQRATEQELQPGDQINIGGFQLEYSLGPAQAVDEEPIDLEAEAEEDSEEPAEAAVAAPPAVKKKKKPKPRALGHARPGTAGEFRYLSDSDPEWVKKLRAGSNMLVLAIALDLLSTVSDRFAGETTMVLLGMGGSICNLLGAWFLTASEPDAMESTAQAMLRLSLRITSTLAAVGGLSLAAANLLENPMLALGGFALFAAIPQFFLLLLYLRILAQRIPNDTLATHCLIVMIGLPSTIVGVIVVAILSGVTRSAAPGLLGLCTGACAILTFAIWYLVIVIWFQRSLN